MTDTLLEMYQLAVKLYGPNSAPALAMKQQLEAREANKGRSAERMFVAGGVGRQMQAVKKGKPA